MLIKIQCTMEKALAERNNVMSAPTVKKVRIGSNSGFDWKKNEKNNKQQHIE